MDEDDEGAWSNMPEVFPASSMVQQNYGGYRSLPTNLQSYRGRMRNPQDYSNLRNLPNDPQDYNSLNNMQVNMPGYGMRNLPDDYQRYQDLGGLQDNFQSYSDLQAGGPRAGLRMSSSNPLAGYGNMRNPWNMALTPRNMVGVPEIWDQQSLRTPMPPESNPWGYRRYAPRESYAYQAPRRDLPMQRLMLEGYPSQPSQQQADLMPYKSV